MSFGAKTVLSLQKFKFSYNFQVKSNVKSQFFTIHQMSRNRNFRSSFNRLCFDGHTIYVLVTCWIIIRQKYEENFKYILKPEIRKKNLSFVL